MSELKTSTVSAKGQITIPVSIRRLLGIGPGDAVLYEVEGKNVRLKKLEQIDLEWARAVESTLSEWQGDEDDDL